MKTIIAGTDFTSSSINACKYAALLARKLNCRLMIFNLFETPVMHSNSGLYGISFTNQRKLSHSGTEKLIKIIREEFPSIKIDSFVSSGLYKDLIAEFASKHLVEAVVMGLGAKDRISKYIFGSHGVNIAGKINAPVIIVPEKYKVHRLSNILLAVDNQEQILKTSLKGFNKFVKQSKCKLSLLHVRTERELFTPKIVDLKVSGEKLRVNMFIAKDLKEGLKKYCAGKTIDLATIISKKHSIFYNLFSETHTKQVAFASKVPVMALHE